MTLNSHVSTITHYTGNGILTDFTIPFAFLKEEHVDFYLDDLLQDSSTYSITNCQERPGDNGCAEGSTLVFSTAPATAVKIAIIRCTPITNETDWRTNLKFQAEVKERAIDKLTMILQEINDRAGLAIKVAGSGPAGDGGGTGLTFRKVADVRVAQLRAKPGTGRYTFRFVDYDKTGSKCFNATDLSDYEAYENNLCNSVPTLADGVRNYVLMYTFKTGSTIYYRFDGGTQCAISPRSACGGPWSVTGILPDGSNGPDFETGGEGGSTTAGNPLERYYEYKDCSDDSSIGWHSEDGKPAYFDQVKKIGAGRPICYYKSATTQLGTNGIDLVATHQWKEIVNCAADECEDCVLCTCGAAEPDITYTYDYCGDTAFPNQNHNCSSVLTGSGPVALSHQGGCEYEDAAIGGASGWYVKVDCDSTNGYWKVNVYSSNPMCHAYPSERAGFIRDFAMPARMLNCAANKPSGSVTFDVAVSGGIAESPIHKCGTIRLVFS